MNTHATQLPPGRRRSRFAPAELRDEFEDVFDFADSLVDDVEGDLLRGRVDADVPAACFVHLLRAVRGFRSVSILCEHGETVDALVNLRAMVSLRIGLTWIMAEHSEARAERYKDMEVVFKRKGLNSILKHHPDDPRYPDDWHKTSLPDPDKIARKHGQKSAAKVFQWHEYSIGAMARATGLHWLYEVFYSHLSDVEHTAPTSLAYHYHRDTTAILIGPPGHRLAQTLLQAAEQLLHVWELSCKPMRLRFRDLTFARMDLDRLVRKHLGTPEAPKVTVEV